MKWKRIQSLDEMKKNPGIGWYDWRSKDKISITEWTKPKLGKRKRSLIRERKEERRLFIVEITINKPPCAQLGASEYSSPWSAAQSASASESSSASTPGASSPPPPATRTTSSWPSAASWASQSRRPCPASWRQSWSFAGSGLRGGTRARRWAANTGPAVRACGLVLLRVVRSGSGVVLGPTTARSGGPVPSRSVELEIEGNGNWNTFQSENIQLADKQNVE